MRQIICYPFVGDSVGGAHLSTIELIHAIDRDQYRPLIVLHEEGSLAEHLRHEQIDFVYLPLERYAGVRPKILHIAASALLSAPKLCHFLLQENVSLVHCNDLRTNMTWVLASRLSGAPFVWHQRTETETSSLFWRLVPMFADHCIAISETTARPLGVLGPKLSIIDNPFAVDIQLDREGNRSVLIDEISADPNDSLIGFVGRLVDLKRPEICISILRKLTNPLGNTVHLLFFGHGSQSMNSRLLELASTLGVKDQVHFMGFRHPIQPYIQALDILIAPSKSDGFGRSLVEAMLLGTPVVASAINSHNEILIDELTGLLDSMSDLNSLAKKVNQLLADKERASEISKRAMGISRQRFSTKRHTLEVQLIYNMLIKTKYKKKSLNQC